MPATDDARAWRSAIYTGRVTHARLSPFRHRFAYRVFSLLLDLDELPALDRDLRLFGHNRRAVVSFHDADHGRRDGTPIRPWVEGHLASAGLADAGHRIALLCFPRLFGYVFNPLSIYYCRDSAGRLRAVLYEVKNTFGEQHGYLIPVPDDHVPGRPVLQQCDKAFYVSPFIDMTARYRFRLGEPGADLSVLIRQEVAEGGQLVASHIARRRPLGDGALARTILGHPMMTRKVMLAIHWQALKLWLAGAGFRRRPAPPAHEVTRP